MGANFRFHLKEDDSWVRKAINRVNLMTEVVPGYTERRGLYDRQPYC